jgi:hypothetical protein
MAEGQRFKARRRRFEWHVFEHGAVQKQARMCKMIGKMIGEMSCEMSYAGPVHEPGVQARKKFKPRRGEIW